MASILPLLLLVLPVSPVVVADEVSAHVTDCEACSPPAAEERRVTFLLEAGDNVRRYAPLVAPVDWPEARSAWVMYDDGKYERASVLEPGMRNKAWRDTGKRELHFPAPEMEPGQKRRVVGILSNRKPTHRQYVWSGDPRLNRRVSCGQCHQGLRLPTATELREERERLETTGKVPPMKPFTPLPTTKGRDFRWHVSLGKCQPSACWECHGRHMVEYQFGQSLASSTRWAPDSPVWEDAADRSVYHAVFRPKGDRVFTHSPAEEGQSEYVSLPSGIHFGQDGLLQRHVSILSEESGKFIARHAVHVDWIADVSAGSEGKAVAREERELTVKNMRGCDGGFALWIDVVSHLRSSRQGASLGDVVSSPVFRVVPPVDAGTTPEHREGENWRATTFISEGTTYTAICFNAPGNPRAKRETPSSGLGYVFDIPADAVDGALIHCRLWVQEDRMSETDILRMAHDLIYPILLERE